MIQWYVGLLTSIASCYIKCEVLIETWCEVHCRFVIKCEVQLGVFDTSQVYERKVPSPG